MAGRASRQRFNARRELRRRCGGSQRRSGGQELPFKLRVSACRQRRPANRVRQTPSPARIRKDCRAPDSVSTLVWSCTVDAIAGEAAHRDELRLATHRERAAQHMEMLSLACCVEDVTGQWSSHDGDKNKRPWDDRVRFGWPPPLHLDSSNCDAFRGLSLDGKVTQHVQCNIHRVRIQPPSTCDVFEDLPIYTLYITGTVSMENVPYLQHRSPLAILDRFEGTGDEIDAPEWISEGEEHLRFYQPRGVFAELFANLALVNLNASQVYTWPDSSRYGPQTPKKATRSLNIRPHKPNSRFASKVVEETE
ncbi:hypothetical protein HWV62_22489 [Athelia sp. TMB]|nr:hypothetical protein HWV62_22489 [Athelia sp. TMB]